MSFKATNHMTSLRLAQFTDACDSGTAHSI